MLNSVPLHGWVTSLDRMVIVTAVTLGFSMLARALHGVSRSGALAGALACFLLFAAAGPTAFAALATLFAMTWVATRLGYRHKLALGIAEPRQGRNASQVLANLAVASLGSVAFSLTGGRLWLMAAFAALAEAATDTVASEVGQASAQARLITTWEHVPAGTDGGVTLRGSLAGLGAGLAIGAVVAIGGMLPSAQLWILVTAGFAGMLFDSILGATLQRRGWMSNQAVNFFATLAAGALAYSLSVLTRP